MSSEGERQGSEGCRIAGRALGRSRASSGSRPEMREIVNFVNFIGRSFGFPGPAVAAATVPGAHDRQGIGDPRDRGPARRGCAGLQNFTLTPTIARLLTWPPGIPTLSP
jgi:hypothetical protein